MLHPHETQHTLQEVAGLLSDLGFQVVSTSINRFEPIGDLEALFESEREYEELARHALQVERRYVPGFFTVLARRQATTRYTWNTSAYSRFTLIPWVRATFQMYSGSA